MGDPLDRVEARLLRLEVAVEKLARRLQALEETEPWDRPARASPGAVAPPGAGAFALSPASADTVRVLSLAGRTLLVFAGAYLLRALTESGVLAAPAGVTLGLLYAAVWLVASDRAGAAGRRLASELHGAAAVVIALPLLWEAATTRQILDVHAGVLALGTTVGLALFVAWRRSVHGLAWVTTAGAMAVGAALFVQTGNAAGYTAFFIALGIATLWLGYDRGWYGLRWPAALAADLAVVEVTARVFDTRTGGTPGAAIGVQLLLLGTYLTMIAARTLVRGRPVIPFEIVQTAAALGVGLGGAMLVTGATGAGGPVVGIGSLLMAGGCYAVAFAFVARRQGRGVNFYFYTSLALALTLAGSHRVLGEPALSLTWGALAMLLTWLGRRFARPALAAHGAVYATAAAGASGLIGVSAAALLSSASVWPSWTPAAYGVLAALTGALSPRPPSGSAWGWAARLPRAVLALLVTVGASGLVTSLLVSAIAGSPAVAGTMLPTIRTCVIALAAVAVALAGRAGGWSELGWFAYPMLVVGAGRLLVDDFRHSPPAMLVIALTVYGAALIMAPRLSRPLTRGTL
jgi:hypothetical protein